MKRRKTSPIWKVDKDTFKRILKNAASVQEAMSIFGLTNKGGNCKTLQARAKEDGVELEMGELINRGKRPPVTANRIQLESKLQTGKVVNNNRLKKQLLKNELIIPYCTMCGCPSVWQDKPLVLVLDHINGDSTDNRISNLRLLCPNCHSQTPTFAGRNNTHKSKDEAITNSEIKARTEQLEVLSKTRTVPEPKRVSAACGFCGRIFTPRSRMHRYCSVKCARQVTRKVKNAPTASELRHLLSNHPQTEVAKIYNVSDKSVEKWCKQMGIATSPRGFWAKYAHMKSLPDRRELQKLTWQMPSTELAEHYNVGENLVRRWWKELGIKKPPPGYWHRAENRKQ